MINPLLVAGQLHGGIAQGVGQALRENIVYDDPVGGLYAHHEIRCLLDHPLSRMMTPNRVPRDASHPDGFDPTDCLCARR